jgi:hypothetical protein
MELVVRGKEPAVPLDSNMGTYQEAFSGIKCVIYSKVQKLVDSFRM